MVEKWAFNTTSYLRKLSEPNVAGKMQSFTLTHFLNAPENCKYQVISCFLPHKQSYISLLLYTNNVCVSDVAWLICCGTTVFFRRGSITFLAIHQKNSSWQTAARHLAHSGTKFILMASSNSRLHVLPFSKYYYSFFSLH